jgi:hypothetical protein
LLSRRSFLVRTAAIAGGSSLLAATSALASTADAVKPVDVTVYKSPSCGCCTKWVDHLKANKAFRVATRDLDDVDPVKDGLGIPARLRSCHVAVAGGYAFEGHVPGDLVAKVLRERPKIAGLAVPGMPVGSPGMEMGPRKDAYDVIAFTKTGTTSVYAKR